MKKGKGNNKTITFNFILILIVLFSFNLSSFYFSRFFSINFINANTLNTQPNSPSMTKDNIGNLWLIYKESRGVSSKLVLLKTDTPYNWNLTKNYILTPNENCILNSYPEIIFLDNSLFISYSLRTPDNSSISILKYNTTTTFWDKFYTLTNNIYSFYNPRLKNSNDSLFLFYSIERIPNKIELFGKIYDKLSYSWSDCFKISENESVDVKQFDFYVDENNTCHIVWSQGEVDHSKIYYCKFFNNKTKSTITELTDGKTNCLYPNIIPQNSDDQLIFWTNITNISVSMFGSTSIHYIKSTKDAQWSNPVKVAPYLSAEKQAIQADGRKSSVTKSSNGVIWVAYEKQEPAPYFSGIGIREVENDQLKNGEQVSLSPVIAFDPQIICDSQDYIHCVWTDFRLAYNELFFRTRYTNNTWSFETQLTNYSEDAYKNNFPRFIGAIVGGIIIIAIIPTTTMYIIRKVKLNRILQQYKEQLLRNDKENDKHY